MEIFQYNTWIWLASMDPAGYNDYGSCWIQIQIRCTSNAD